MKKILSILCTACMTVSLMGSNPDSSKAASTAILGVIKQAEDCELTNCSIGTYGYDYEGSGYVEYINAIRDNVKFSINGIGEYTDLLIRYSQGTDVEQTLSLFVNGKFVQKINFAPTGEWNTTWDSINVPIYLSSGSNTVELRYTDGDGDVDIDYFCCTARDTSNKMVIVPHEDDEIFAFCASIQRMVESGDDVKVVLMTNGDYNCDIDASIQDSERFIKFGKKRIMETVNALSHVGVPKESVIVLGYGDAIISNLYANKGTTQSDTTIICDNGNNQTYGNPDNNIYDYHTIMTESPASYTYSNLINDLKNVISVNMPDEIFTTSAYDTHPDHSATYRFVETAIESIKTTENYKPLLHESVVHGEDEMTWPEKYSVPNYETPPTPVKSFDNPFPSNSVPLYWENVTKITLTSNELVNKFTAIGEYVSQNESWKDFNYSFYKSDEFYWTRDYANIAPYATVTVSSENTATGQLKEKAVDRVVAGYDMNLNSIYGYPEWVTYGETTGAWIKLDFSEIHAVNKIILNDRITTVDNIVSARLDFSDGSSIDVADIPANGTDCVVNFNTKNITWVKLTVTQGTGYNVGLAEFQVIEV